MTAYTVTIHTVPPSLNVLLRMHWAERARVMGRLRDWTAGCVRYAQVPPLGRARITITRYAPGRPLDADNAAGAMKPVLDGIKVAGVVTDDDATHVQVTYASARCAASEGRVEVVIEPWEGDAMP